MTRHSQHVASARVVAPDGSVTDLGAVAVELNLDESQAPYGGATVTAAMPQDADQLAASDPRTRRGLRMLLELRESTGDPVTADEITADHGGSIASLTATYGPGVDLVSAAAITTTYFVPWNQDADVRPGGAVTADLIITSRQLDHRGHTASWVAQTDEKLAQLYKLIATSTQSSSSLSVRGTVNFALAKIGAVLDDGPTDATIAEADGILWEPGTSAWDYMRGVAEAAGLVVRCDERRRWTLTDRSATRPESVTLDAFTDATERVDLADDTWADAVVVRYEWTDPATGDVKVRFDTATDTADPIKVVRVDRATPYPGAGAARYWLNRLRARGRVFDLETVGDYTLRPGMGFTGSLPYTPAQIGYLESITWSVPSDRGRITTRGSADAHPNAIDLWPAGLKISQLTGKINALITTSGA